jgi:hypothetical protein
LWLRNKGKHHFDYGIVEVLTSNERWIGIMMLGLFCITPCLKGWMNWSNSPSLNSVLYVTLLLPWNYAKQICIALLCAHFSKFMKVKLWDRLCEHLDLIVCMFVIVFLHFWFLFLQWCHHNLDQWESQEGFYNLKCGKHNSIFSFGFKIV